MYAYSDDQGCTWRNNEGRIVGNSQVSGQVMRLDSPGITVVPISRAHCLMNTQAQAVDSQGRIHAVVWHATEESLRQAQRRARAAGVRPMPAAIIITTGNWMEPGTTSNFPGWRGTVRNCSSTEITTLC